MNLMKWLRKNNRKIMAIVVVVLMIAFIGGSSFSFLMRGSGGIGKAIAYYGPKHKITYRDRITADHELEILTALRADDVLRAQDLRGILLSELVFAHNRNAAVLDIARQTIQRNRYRISDKQLSEMYKDRTVPSDLYWILLCKEAQSAGIHISNEEAGTLLGGLIPQLFDSRGYTEVMQMLMSKFNSPEEKILTTFSKLLAVLQYAQIISSMENVTTAQIKHLARNEAESLSSEFVQLKASYFADKGQTPPPGAVLEQFNRYKAYSPGEVNEANPFGFGYKLPARVQFEYIALKLPDVATVTKPPTEEDAERYYQQNRDRQFTEQVPADPNDPNSPQVPRVKGYAEVAGTILDQLRRQRIVTKAEQILQEARNQADTSVQMDRTDGQEPTTEQRREKAAQYDFAKFAEELGKKHGVPLYSGRTGLLSAMDTQNDKYLRRMFLTTYGRNPIPLSQMLFSVKELADEATILLSAAPAEMYMSIGPARDPMAAMASDLSGQIMVLARVVGVEKSVAPASLDDVYSTKTLGLGDTSEPQDKTFSVKEQVEKDVKNLSAWDTTRSRADEFMALAVKDGWDPAIAQFNKLYGAQAKEEPNDPNVFKLDRLDDLQRLSNADLQVLAAQVANNPAADTILNQAKAEARFIDRLFSLVPAQSDAPPQTPITMESKANQSYYVLRSLSVHRLTLEEFQRMKGMLVRREEYSQTENLAAVHFNPDNILKRMNFRFAEPVEKQAEDQAKEKAKEAS